MKFLIDKKHLKELLIWFNNIYQVPNVNYLDLLMQKYLLEILI